MKTFILSSLLLVSSSFGLTLLHGIPGPKTCPDNLKVTSRALPEQNEIFQFSIEFENEETERRKASAFLQIQQDSETLARVSLSPTIKGETYTFTAEISRKAAKESTLTLSTYLCDDSGLTVIGGGEVFEIDLGGFLPVQTKVVD